MKIVDTDIIIDCLRDVKQAKKCLSEIHKDERYFASVTLMELLVGCRNKREIREIKEFLYLNFKDILHIDTEISGEAVRLVEKYARSHGLQLADSLIGTTALVRDAVVYTGNVRDFKYISGLKVEGVPYKTAGSQK